MDQNQQMIPKHQLRKKYFSIDVHLFRAEYSWCLACSVSGQKEILIWVAKLLHVIISIQIYEQMKNCLWKWCLPCFSISDDRSDSMRRPRESHVHQGHQPCTGTRGPIIPMKFRGGSPMQVRNDSRRGSHRAGCMNSHKDNIWAPTASIKTRWQGLATIG